MKSLCLGLNNPVGNRGRVGGVCLPLGCGGVGGVSEE